MKIYSGFLCVVLATLLDLGFAPSSVMAFTDEQPDQLAGTWVGKVVVDSEQLKKNGVLSGVSEGKLGGVAFALQLLASSKQMTLVFNPDGTAINELKQGSTTRKKQVKWRLAKSENDLRTVEMVDDKTGEKTTFAFRTLKPDQLELVLPAAERTRGIRHLFDRKK